MQVIAPMRRGPYGVSRFNTCLQAWLNPPTPSKHELPAGPSSSGKVFRLNDRVMQVRMHTRQEAHACAGTGRVLGMSRSCVIG